MDWWNLLFGTILSAFAIYVLITFASRRSYLGDLALLQKDSLLKTMAELDRPHHLNSLGTKASADRAQELLIDAKRLRSFTNFCRIDVQNKVAGALEPMEKRMENIILEGLLEELRDTRLRLVDQAKDYVIPDGTVYNHPNDGSYKVQVAYDKFQRAELKFVRELMRQKENKKPKDVTGACAQT